MKKIYEICDVLNGYAFKSKHYVDSGIRVIRIANVQDGYISDENPCFYPNSSIDDIEKYILKENDLLISLTGNVGRVALLNKEYLPAALNQRVACLRIKDSYVDKKYLFYYLNQRKFIDDCIKASKGVAQLNLSTKWLESYQLDIPPIKEQERIVAKIEELFSDLDNAVETLNATKAQLEVYRRAVLKESFFGDYPKKTLGEISKTISGYAFKSSKYTPDGKYTVIKIGNVKDRHFDFSRDHTLTNEVNETILEKYLMRKGDCLITLTGSRGKRDYGFVTMIDKQTNFLLNQRVAALRFDEEYAIPEFYQYYLSSSDYREKFFSYETGNVGQGNVGVKALTEPLVICPPKEEQKTIITKIESRLSMCDQIENTVTSALVQASAMRQSILKQAFEGRLLNGK